MTITSGEINLQSKQDIICHVAKLKPATSAHYLADVIPFLAYVIDHFHKWRPIINYFASIKISLTDLILKSIIQKKFYSETRLVRLI